MNLNRLFRIVALLVLITGFSGPVFSEDVVKIDINTATVEELTQLKDIGPKKAEAIVKYRTENGPFSTPADLLNVKGIGEKIFRSNLDKIVASPVSAVTQSVTGSAAKKAAGALPGQISSKTSAPAGKEAKIMPQTPQKSTSSVNPREYMESTDNKMN